MEVKLKMVIPPNAANAKRDPNGRAVFVDYPEGEFDAVCPSCSFKFMWNTTREYILAQHGFICAACGAVSKPTQAVTSAMTPQMV